MIQLKIILIGLLTGLAVCIYILDKNENTLKRHLQISNAVADYLHDAVDKCKSLEEFKAFDSEIIKMYESIEDYDKTLYRFWDWGYTRIVPSDVLEKIEPFLRRD